jgi:protein involved in polysaccharide export with SLBB domain
MRLWDLIELAGGLRPETYAGRAQLLRVTPDSTRQLLGFALEPGSPSQPGNNPALREGDEVTVYAMTDFRPARYVVVNGAVSRPGRIMFADSMTLQDAVLLAGGLTEGAYLDAAEVSRLKSPPGVGGDSLVQILRVALDSSYLADATGGRDGSSSARAPTVALQPYDHVFVRREPGWEIQRNVVLSGEVRFPGTYTLTHKDERLSSVITRAGGLTENAYADGIEFRRSRGGAGRLPVDLPRDDLVLEPGDSIHIPRFTPVVRVEGAVQYPASVTFRPGAGIDYYVNAAGGYTSRADKRRTYILQPNGLIEKRGRPGAGAVIQVPQKDPSEGGPSLIVVLGALAPVVSAATTILVALIIR